MAETGGGTGPSTGSRLVHRITDANHWKRIALFIVMR
jgi:hypothetical protein